MSNKNNNIYPVGAIKHDDEHRASIPTTELAGEESLVVETMSPEGQYKQFKHDFDRGRDPELYWLGKYVNDNEETQSSDLKVDTRSLYRHEEIRPEMLINQLYTLKEDEKAANMVSLFGNELPKTAYEDELQRITEYYQHNADWRNRLIQGDSLLVMNSLLQREGMAGRVQMIYIDPPYGIKYGSNWQMKLNNRDVKDNDESLSGEPEMIKAFRDTWELGIHSYLSYLRDRLVLARELLTESGSCFVQISDENVHLVRCLMDEVFGSENFVSQITFRKKLMPLGDKLLEEMSNFIIWYAKDKTVIKYRQLYKKTLPNPQGRWTGVCEDGKLRRFTKEEKQDFATTLLTKKVFGTVSQWAPSYFETNVYEFVFEGRGYYPTTGQCWITSKEKMDKLAKLGTHKYLFKSPHADGYNFSYSGLKTSIINEVNKLKMRNEDYKIEDIAKSFQDVAIDVIVEKAKKACKEYNVKMLCLAGGVSANSYLRSEMEKAFKNSDIRLLLPPLWCTTDNAAMICKAAEHLYKEKIFADLSLGVDPNWQIEDFKDFKNN